MKKTVRVKEEAQPDNLEMQAVEEWIRRKGRAPREIRDSAEAAEPRFSTPLAQIRDLLARCVVVPWLGDHGREKDDA